MGLNGKGEEIFFETAREPVVPDSNLSPGKSSDAIDSREGTYPVSAAEKRGGQGIPSGSNDKVDVRKAWSDELRGEDFK